MALAHPSRRARRRDGAAADRTGPRNPLYADILRRFRAATGRPVLVNTSFNVHEEPIVNRPEECLQALTEGRVDFVVTRNAVYTLATASQIAEDISAGAELKVFLGAPEGATGTLVLDIGIVEVA